ncbi:MAG: GntR family transcriptional regulator, partial [Firmicutes bacterium]|nr:GntR family transcriptional regulator [Bacillota bacterium]
MKNRFALKPIRTTLTMRELVYEQLHNAIINGVFKPGDRLVERELANIVGVSKTPVREATRQLEQEGLVQIVPYKGIIVTELSFTQVKEVYDLRSLLDGFASYLAAK